MKKTSTWLELEKTLKPCPFCGGKAIIEQIFQSCSGYSGPYITVSCISCEAAIDHKQDLYPGVDGPQRLNSIDLWNMRKRETAKWLDKGPDVECSNCGFTNNDSYYMGAAKFCPTCGAEMENPELAKSWLYEEV